MNFAFSARLSGSNLGGTVNLRSFAAIAFAVLGFAAAGPSLAKSGYVHDLSGSATVREGAGAPRALRVGDLVDAGQTVSTAEKSAAVIKFEDGQVMALHERSAFTIQEYSYDKKNVSASRAAFNLLQGGLRFITGVIGSTNRNAFRMAAGTATIGVRGTDGTVMFDPVTQIVTAAVNAGALAITNPLGTQTIGVGNFSSVSPNQAPRAPAPVAQALPAVRATLNSLAQARNIPVNTPVVIAQSARAAAAQARASELRQQAAANPQNQALQQQALQAEVQATQALSQAISAAQDAYTAAIQAGAVTPAPAAPPPPPSDPTPTPSPTPTTTDPTPTPTTTTTGTPTGTSGAGGGGTASPN